ncbi:MAG TPA: hypothetical protein VM734_34885 [Kofleriaceae bacterium]|jgi:hypothetical protein|nr:hypothetical protein [Kofleriaceae bacterium]
MTRFALTVLALASLAGCDSRATASSASPTTSLGRPSKELESCGTTSHCGDGLRCFDGVCQREARSNLGDFLAARGARALTGGDVDGAIAAYAEALATYEREALGVPPDVDCAYGQALTRASGTKDKAELAARVLHRCLLAVPPGGRLRAAALAALAELDAAGLDPNQLSKPQLADLYLTKAPARPATDKLAVGVTAEPTPQKKSYASVAERLAQADLKAAFIACWERNFADTKAKELVAKVGIKVSYKASDYDDEPGTYTITVPSGDNACVKAAIEPALTGLKTVRDSFETTLVVTVK